MHSYIIIFICLRSIYALPQQVSNADTSRVKLIQDPRVAELMEKKTRISKKTKGRFSGFRVQIYSSTSIDEANAKVAEVQGILPMEWFYVVYDAPAYEIRAGNFLKRFDADKFVRQLSDRGYRDAWVVPEKVFKNPPPRPPSPEEDQAGKK